MPFLAYRSRVTVAIALVAPCLLSLRMMFVPETLSSFTYVLSTAGIITLAVLALHAQRISQPVAHPVALPSRVIEGN